MVLARCIWDRTKPYVIRKPDEESAGIISLAMTAIQVENVAGVYLCLSRRPPYGALVRHSHRVSRREIGGDFATESSMPLLIGALHMNICWE